MKSNRQDIRPELNEVDGLLVMNGGVPITAEGAFLGAVGVSGAPSGLIDEECAQAGYDAVAERLEFLE